MFKNKKTKEVLGIIFALLVVGFVGWYIFQDFSVKDIGEINNPTENVVKEGDIETLVESGDAEIKEIPVNLDLNADSVIRPKLNRAVSFPDRFSQEAVDILQNNINELTTQLEQNRDSFQAWSDLANQYKIIDDFEGAAEIWEFLSISIEDNIDTRINLGNLYHYQLKEYERSEAVFNDVINIDKKTAGAYVGLHELYRYSYKTDTVLAIDVLKEGIVAIPNNTDIRMLLASYYTELGMKDEASSVYEDVLKIANTAGDTNLVTIVEAAIENL